jgi:hypothetical protein
MQTPLHSLFLLLATAASALAAPAPGPVEQTVPAPTDYAITQNGPHSRVWQRITLRTNSPGRVSAATNSYTELATGLNFWNEAAGAWAETREQFGITPEGSATATNGQHKLTLPPDIGASAALVDLRAADGQRLASRPMFLSFGESDGRSALLARVTNSAGQLTAQNVILYPAAFDTLRASLRYTYTRAGIEQDVILYQRLPSPSDYGFDPDSTSLEMWTEFPDGPTPTITAVSRTGDQILSFGQTRIARGAAYLVNSQASDSIGLKRAWATVDGRHFLIESVPYNSIKPLSDQLQASAGSRNRSRTAGHAFPDRGKLVAGAVRPKARATEIARIKPGVVSKELALLLDYQTITTSQSNFTFFGDSTYYASSQVTLSGTTTCEGGAILKLAPTNSTGLSILGPITCKTADYRPFIVTSRDDNTAGESIPGSTGNPTNSSQYGGLIISTTNNALHDLRFAYAKSAVFLSFEAGQIALTNVQFVNCTYAIDSSAYDENTIRIYNGLFYSSYFVIKGGIDLDVQGENLTIDRCFWVAVKGGGLFDSFGSFRLTNSLVVAATNGWGVVPNTNYTALFTNDPGNIFGPVGAANHYLADNSPYRNAGTTNINPSLLAGLRTKTTYPPVVISNATLTADTVLAPQAQRDLDAPDLGYHYYPIDYALHSSRASNATLQVQAGTALATAGSYGLGLRGGARLVCQGAPTSPIHIVRYNLVQESANTNWDGEGQSVAGNAWGDMPQPQIACRFTDWSMPAQDGNHISADSFPATVSFSDCQFHGGKLLFSWPPLAFTNTLLERVVVSLDDQDGGLDLSPIFRNCLFFGGTLTLHHGSGDTWLFRDNLFDRTSIAQSGDTPDVDGAYNAYVTNCNRLTPTNTHDVVVTNTDYVTGPLDNPYYYPTNGGGLSLLLNVGSTNADLLGLFHQTLITNLVSGLQIRETNSIVDIGWHRPALDTGPSTPIPIDDDGDGVPSYLEDANGNGSVQSGETDWQSATDLGLKVIITRPKNGSTIP